MFLQVGVREEDRISLRLLWREDPKSNVVVHQYTRHFFGAPDLCDFALQKTAFDHHVEYPEAASADFQFYMDDYLDSFQNSDDAMKFSKVLVLLLKTGVFHLIKCVSNVPDRTTALDPDNRETNASVKAICKSPNHSSHNLVIKGIT